MKVLELSYNDLEKDCKEIFLDVACILKGWLKEDAVRALESRGFRARIGLGVLEQRSLITYNKVGRLWMHDHLEEMGRNIVRRSHPDEPQRHSRLWKHKEIEHILTNKLGTPATQCLCFWEPGFSAEIAIKGLAKMKDLKVLYIRVLHKCKNWKFDKVSEYLPSSLRFMRWWGFPFSSLPNTFQGKHLVELQIGDSKIVQLWEDGEEKVLNNLRFLTIKDSNLRTFDLRLAPNLEQLTIMHCDDFVELRITADHHSKLEHLDLSYLKLKTIHLGSTPNLKTLKLEGSHDLVEFQMPPESLKLAHIDISHSKLKTIHLGKTPNLKTLILYYCDKLVLLPELGRVKCLKELNILHTGIRRLPQSILQLQGLHIIGSPEIQTSYREHCSQVSRLSNSAVHGI